MTSLVSEAPMRFVENGSTVSNRGARCRRTRPGPEQDLIESFLQSIPLTIPRGCRVTAFREPRLESGFPDMVFVVWREEIARGWRSERAFLEPFDLRLMHFLHRKRSAREDDLSAYFGKRATDSLGRLHDAGMIRLAGSAWVPLALRQTFAASKIIAIEAKVGRWADVLNQAMLNTWFASKSYVLVSRPPSERQLADARRHGIGVCSLDDGKVTEVASESTRLPRSYASWMLNEWAWRSAEDIWSQRE